MASPEVDEFRAEAHAMMEGLCGYKSYSEDVANVDREMICAAVHLFFSTGN